MKRLLVLTLAFSCTGTPSVLADQLRYEGRPIKQALLAQVSTPAPEPNSGSRTNAAVSATQEQRDEADRGTSIWKTPWPYLIIGGAVAVAAIAASGGYSSNGGGGSGDGGNGGGGGGY